MTPRRKKPANNGNAKKSAAAQAAAPLPEDFFHSLVWEAGQTGFRQVILPPLEEKKIYEKSPLLRERFGGRMFTASDPEKKEELALSPTHVASIMKRYMQSMPPADTDARKWFYLSPLHHLQKDKPALAHELGMFVLGDHSPLAYTNLLNGVYELFSVFELPELVVELNSIGCESCQDDYKAMLREHLDGQSAGLCESCTGKFQKQPFDVWACTATACREASESSPQVVDFLDTQCTDTLRQVLESADELEIPYLLNPILATPLADDRIVFRLSFQKDDHRETLGWGGSFANWGSLVGAKSDSPLAAIGFLSVFENWWPFISEDKQRMSPKTEVFLVSLGDSAARRIILLSRQLRRAGIRVADEMLCRGGIKQQFKYAASRKSELALIMGQKEALDDTVILRDIRSGMQEVFSYDRIVEEVQKRLSR